MRPPVYDVEDWDFEWNDGANVAELAVHHIRPSEVEQVFYNGAAWKRNKRLAAGNFKMIGRTDGGRMLTIAVLLQQRERVVHPITGWDAESEERQFYLRDQA